LQTRREAEIVTSKPTRVLVVEDDESMREVLRMRLSEWGFAVGLAADAREAERRVQASEPEIVLSDVVMPGLSGLDLLRTLKGGDSSRSIVLITAHSTAEMAEEAIQGGARDLLTKPLDYSKLKAILTGIQRDLETRPKMNGLAADSGKGFDRFGEFVGNSGSMRQVYRLIKAAATVEAPVLLTGASGTGKGLAARTIHQMSGRCTGPFVAVDAAAVSKELIASEFFGHEKGAFSGALDLRRGCFELAHRGTLFFCEITEIPLELQLKLLRVLEKGSVCRMGGSREFRFDVRLLAATQREPRKAIREGRLREDLFHRLNALSIPFPPLRRRREDIPLLARHFLAEFNRKLGRRLSGLDTQTLRLLADYFWPGNVRELRSVIERAVTVATSEWIEPSDLPPHLQGPDHELSGDVAPPPWRPPSEAERQLILGTLGERGNIRARMVAGPGIGVREIRDN
jgi:DNA-binding NtrC family response regulator